MPMNYESLMQIALAEAAKSGTDVPVGAIILDEQHEIIAMAHNNREVTHDPTGHAEIIAIREATAKIEDWRLENCTLVVTLEPCVMCAGASFWTQISRIVYGANEDKRGFTRINQNLLHPKTLLQGGVLAEESGLLMTNFFRDKRKEFDK